MRVFIIVICAAFSSFVMASCVANKGSFLLINKANEPIVWGSVTVCGQTIELKDIQPTDSALGFHKVKSDSHFDIRIEFQSGKKLRKEMGYVTSGMDFHHEFVVTNSDIEIMSSIAK
jgi:hypothetical protein